MEDRGQVDEGSSVPSDETHEAARRHTDPRTWTEKFAAVPGPDSPFYLPPPSSSTLRRSVTFHIGFIAIFTVAVLAAALRNHDAAMEILLLFFWVAFTWWRAYQVRALLKELARRRESGDAAPDR